MRRTRIALATVAALAGMAMAAPIAAADDFPMFGGLFNGLSGVIGGAVGVLPGAGAAAPYGAYYGYGPSYYYAPAQTYHSPTKYYGPTPGCVVREERFWDGAAWIVRPVQACF
jgi:hypothetical protein